VLKRGQLRQLSTPKAESAEPEQTRPPHSTLGGQVPYAMEEITDLGCRQKRG
jgi:hypothetical protein